MHEAVVLQRCNVTTILLTIIKIIPMVAEVPENIIRIVAIPHLLYVVATGGHKFIAQNYT